MNADPLGELLLQALAHERGGIKVYEGALRCTLTPGLRQEWSQFLSQKRRHERALLEVFERLGLDPEQQTPAREVTTQLCAALVRAMQQARESGDSAAAQLVACDVVVLSETKAHANWDLLARVMEQAQGVLVEALRPAITEVEDAQDQHLYHARSWCRELWRKSLHLSAILPAHVGGRRRREAESGAIAPPGDSAASGDVTLG